MCKDIYERLVMEKIDKNAEILLIDKPSGITSFDVIRILRKKLGVTRESKRWKMGHAGTLDPLATGLLIVGIGDGTKKMTEFIKLPKTYIAEILLGTKTDTGDISGTILEKKIVRDIPDDMLQTAIASMKGSRTVNVPMYSAIKVSGKKLYQYAREGNTSVIPPRRTMEVMHATLDAILRGEEHIVLVVIFRVSSGTYIRTLAEEVGRLLGVPATIQNLRRTQIGSFDVKDAILL